MTLCQLQGEKHVEKINRSTLETSKLSSQLDNMSKRFIKHCLYHAMDNFCTNVSGSIIQQLVDILWLHNCEHTHNKTIH